jgi:hypothetical protein
MPIILNNPLSVSKVETNKINQMNEIYEMQSFKLLNNLNNSYKLIKQENQRLTLAPSIYNSQVCQPTGLNQKLFQPIIGSTHEIYDGGNIRQKSIPQRKQWIKEKVEFRHSINKSRLIKNKSYHLDNV